MELGLSTGLSTPFSHLLFLSSCLFLLCQDAVLVLGRRSEKSIPSLFVRHFDCIVSLRHNGKPIVSTVGPEGQHLDNVTAQFTAFGKLFTVDLKLNRVLFPASYVETVYHSHGQSSETRHIDKKVENCYYHGKVRNQPKSDAALSTCSGLRGYITDKYDSYHIEPLSQKIHRVFRSRDMRSLPFKCGTEGHDSRLYNHQMVMKRHKRSLRAPYDSDSKTRYVELYLVNDQRTYERQAGNETLVIKRSHDIANIVSSLYRPLGIYIALVGVEVWTHADLARVTTKADKTMENFLTYRKERINPKYHNDNAQLITGVYFENGVVGKAIKGPICTNQFSGGVNMDYGGQVSLVATTVAHEMGHNFGMEHDNDTICECRDNKCIMAATSGQISPSRWSSCSRNALTEAFDLGMDYCLRNLPQATHGGPTCGNGFLEDGEECDCGLPQDCSNRCCNASTCKVYPLAQCASGQCCDLHQCRPKPVSSLCRASRGECDLAEYCNGTSELCPEDVFVNDGQTCKRGQSYCYKGQCNTHSDQCRLLWGETGRVSDPICFQQLNMNGNEDGNCGYNWTKVPNPKVRCRRCEREDVMCGLLHCVHLNEKLMFWRDNLAIAMRASFLTRGNTQYVCRSAMLDVGLDMPDPGFVPDGAKCEHNKICIQQKCVDIAKLKPKLCPDDCNGHGRCNSYGHCHCDVGYAPPLCNKPGFGGSLDSGPASNEYDNQDIRITILLVVLVVFPLIILIVLAFLNRRRLAQWWKQMPGLLFRRGHKASRPPPQPPHPGPGNGQTWLMVDPPFSGNPLLNDRPQRGRVWSPGVNSAPPPPKPAVPPARPNAAPCRPAALAKMTNSAESKSRAKKVRLSTPIQETEGPAIKPSAEIVTSASSKQEASKTIPSSPKTGKGLVKRESFRGSEISDPVLVCTTNRNSLVLAEGNVDIIGPEAKHVTRSPVVTSVPSIRRSQSDRPVSKAETTKSQPAVIVPGLHKSASSASSASAGRSHEVQNGDPTSAESVSTPGIAANQQSKPTGFTPRPMPPIPSSEEDDTQPLYNNDSSSDLLAMIDGALQGSNVYNNVTASHPIQETLPPPSVPPRPSDRKSIFADTSNSGNNKPGALSSEKADSQQEPLLKVSKKEDRKSPAFKVPKKNSAAIKPETQSLLQNKDGDVMGSKTNSALKGAVSDELRNKILLKSTQKDGKNKLGNEKVAPKTGLSNSNSQKASTANVHSNKPKLGSTQTAQTARNIPGKQTKKAENPQGSRPQLKPKVPVNSLTDSSASSKGSSPATTKTSAALTASKVPSGNKANPSAAPRGMGKAGSKASSTNTAASAASVKTEAPATTKKPSVSSLAAKFGAPPAEASNASSSKPLLRTESAPKPLVRSNSGAKPDPLEKTLVRTQSSKSPSRPSLPPKPGDRSGTAQAPVPNPAAAPKRVQSYRI